MERWSGKVAIVTGASSGIGAAIVGVLVQEGLQVAGFARRKEIVEEFSKKLENFKGKLHAVKVDVTKEEEVIAGFEWVKKNLGPIHILVNNSGIAKETHLIDGDYQKWKDVFDTNVLGLCVATREAVKDMKENNIDGHIIHINSITGHYISPSFVFLNIYPASKFAITALTETLRQELLNNKLKIKISSISPGAVETNFFHSAKLDSIVDFNKVAALKSEDVAEAVRYVLSTPPHVQVHDIIIKAVGEEC